MSHVIIIDPALKQKVEIALRDMARDHHRSIANLIRPEAFQSVVDAVSEDIAIEFPCFDSALLASVSRIRSRMPAAFLKTRMNPAAAMIFRKTT